MVYGRPALVAAVDLRLTAHFETQPDATPGRVWLELPALGLVVDTSWAEIRDYARRARAEWQRYCEQPSPERFRALRGDDPAHVVKTALGETLVALGDDRLEAGRLRIDSRLPIGSGFGSSAATATAVIGACLAWQGEPLDRQRIERLALEVERRQHGLPSGVDGATVIRGGVLWLRKADGGLEAEPIAPRSPLLSRLRVFDSGTPPEPTGAVVAAVRARRERDAAGFDRLLDRIETAARGLRAELLPIAEDSARVLELMRDCEACLEAMGVVPKPVQEIVRRIAGAGGAAKISGAGSLAGPGAGSLLVYHPVPDSIAGWPFLEPFPFHAVRLGAPGLRQETDA